MRLRWTLGPIRRLREPVMIARRLPGSRCARVGGRRRWVGRRHGAARSPQATGGTVATLRRGAGASVAASISPTIKSMRLWSICRAACGGWRIGSVCRAQHCPGATAHAKCRSEAEGTRRSCQRQNKAKSGAADGEARDTRNTLTIRRPRFVTGDEGAKSFGWVVFAQCSSSLSTATLLTALSPGGSGRFGKHCAVGGLAAPPVHSRQGDQRATPAAGCTLQSGQPDGAGGARLQNSEGSGWRPARCGEERAAEEGRKPSDRGSSQGERARARRLRLATI